MLSLWEKNWLFDADTIIVGSGIVGLSSAAAILESQPSHQVLILERGLIPTGASTRNAGFASIGSYYEVLKDLELLGEKECFRKVKDMYDSVSKLRKRVGEKNLGFRQDGGYDIFTENMLPKLEHLKRVNDLVRPIFKDDAFYLTTDKIQELGLNKDIVKGLVFNKYEGQIDSGKAILNFQKYVGRLGGRIITGAEVTDYKKDGDKSIIVDIKDPMKNGEVRQFRCQNLVFCTDTYSEKFVKNMDFHPVRGQVVVTSPIKDLKLKGSFLFHDGYFYARDYHGRLLIGGGAYLFWEEESTYELKTTEKIMTKIKQILKDVLLPGKEFTIEHEWAGLMCYGKESEEPIITKLEDNVYAAIRLAGDGVARASQVGEMVKDMVLESHQVRPRL